MLLASSVAVASSPATPSNNSAVSAFVEGTSDRADPKIWFEGIPPSDFVFNMGSAEQRTYLISVRGSADWDRLEQKDIDCPRGNVFKYVRCAPEEPRAGTSVKSDQMLSITVRFDPTSLASFKPKDSSDPSVDYFEVEEPFRVGVKVRGNLLWVSPLILEAKKKLEPDPREKPSSNVWIYTPEGMNLKGVVVIKPPTFEPPADSAWHLTADKPNERTVVNHSTFRRALKCSLDKADLNLRYQCPEFLDPWQSENISVTFTPEDDGGLDNHLLVHVDDAPKPTRLHLLAEPSPPFRSGVLFYLGGSTLLGAILLAVWRHRRPSQPESLSGAEGLASAPSPPMPRPTSALMETKPAHSPRLPLTVLHLTDLHFAKPSERFPSAHYWNTPEWPDFHDAPHNQRGLLESLQKDLENNHWSPDVVVISGDLLDRAQESGVPLAIDFLKKLEAMLKLSPERFVLVPGNHDEVRGAKTEDERYALFSRIWTGFYPKQLRPWIAGRAAHAQVELFDLREPLGLQIIGFNSCEGLNRGLMAGAVGVDQRERAEKLLGRAGKAPFRIAVMHHHLYNPTGTRKDMSVMEGAPEIMGWLKTHQFQLALHGHQHVDWRQEDSTGDWILSVAAGASAGVGEYGRQHWNLRVGYQVLRIETEGHGNMFRRRYDPMTRSFEAASTNGPEILRFGSWQRHSGTSVTPPATTTATPRRGTASSHPLNLFLTHCDFDTAFAKKLHEEFQRSGVRTFSAPFSNVAGEHVVERLKGVLSTCDAGVLIWSNAAKESGRLIAEAASLLAQHLDEGLPLFIVSDGSEVPSWLQNIEPIRSNTAREITQALLGAIHIPVPMPGFDDSLAKLSPEDKRLAAERILELTAEMRANQLPPTLYVRTSIGHRLGIALRHSALASTDAHSSLHHSLDMIRTLQRGVSFWKKKALSPEGINMDCESKIQEKEQDLRKEWKRLDDQFELFVHATW